VELQGTESKEDLLNNYPEKGTRLEVLKQLWTIFVAKWIVGDTDKVIGYASSFVAVSSPRFILMSRGVKVSTLS
jgi:hypothetical protein